MSSTDLYPPSYPRRDTDSAGRRHDANPGLLTRAETWLDDRGRWAWIAAMVGGFIFFWPVGLALLAYMIWSNRMFSKHSDREGRRGNCGTRKMSSEQWQSARTAMRPSGNGAFDAYKSETLRRLEDEQHAFEEFLARLRHAKDKTEFDAFMDERARRASTAPSDTPQDEDRAA